MTDLGLSRPTLADRWPSLLALAVVAGGVSVVALLDREADLFGPSVATMAGIYLVAYALGRPLAVWPAFVALSAVVSVLQVLQRLDVSGADPAIGMTVVLVVLWLWSVARGRSGDRATFGVQTAGMAAFGVITLLCAALDPRWGALAAGLGFIAHGAWDWYHFLAGKVVDRRWAEFCGVVDPPVGVALIVSALI